MTQRSEWLSWDWQTSRLRLWFGAEIFFSIFWVRFWGLNHRLKHTFATVGGGNSNIFHFHPYLRKMSILANMFQMG